MLPNIDKTCRICMNNGDISIYGENNYANQIESIANIQINENDGYPRMICNFCVGELHNVYNFKRKIEMAALKFDSLLAVNNEEIIYEFVLKNECNVDDDIVVQDPNYVDDVELKIDQIIEKFSEEDNPIKYEERNECYEEISIEQIKIGESVNDDITTTGKKDTQISKTKDIQIKCVKVRPKRPNVKSHMCIVCGKTFLYRSNLEDHERIHTGDKPFECSDCGQKFSQRGHLMVHMRKHTGEKPYKCHICPKAFVCNTVLKRHIISHTGDRRLECSICFKKFTESFHLTAHFRRHTGEKNFKCDYPGCVLAFVNACEMRRHRKKHDNRKQKVTSNC